MTNSKLQSGIKILKMMRYFLHGKQLSYLFIKPYLYYGALTREAATKTHVNKIDRSLKKNCLTCDVQR